MQITEVRTCVCWFFPSRHLHLDPRRTSAEDVAARRALIPSTTSSRPLSTSVALSTITEEASFRCVMYL